MLESATFFIDTPNGAVPSQNQPFKIVADVKRAGAAFIVPRFEILDVKGLPAATQYGPIISAMNLVHLAMEGFSSALRIARHNKTISCYRRHAASP